MTNYLLHLARFAQAHGVECYLGASCIVIRRRTFEVSTGQCAIQVAVIRHFAELRWWLGY